MALLFLIGEKRPSSNVMREVAPFIWTGLEYFRSELYCLKFSWLNIGYAFANFQVFPFHILGMYGVGFLVAAIAASFLVLRCIYAAAVLAIILLLSAFFMPALADIKSGQPPQLQIAGVQLEFPSEHIVLQALNQLKAKYPEADVLVLSEYTLDGAVPDSLENWCRTNNRYLIVGGKDQTTNSNYYNTAFVVSPKGEIVFRQAKSVPIQFFIDGLPAPQQAVWDSPWGKIGICICYDLSYTRVTDGLVRLGAQLLIVPTMDVTEWGKHEHELHTLVAPVRAAEYGIPIFRLASSGISQAVNQSGNVIANAPFLGQNKTLIAGFRLPLKGTLPLDRFLAPLSVGVTVFVLITIILGFPKKKHAQK